MSDLHRRVRLPVELHPGDVDPPKIGTGRVAVDVDGLVVRELPVRALALPVAVPGAHLRELLIAAVEPGPAPIARATDEQRNLVRRREVERLADEVSRPIGAEGDGRI